jgi:predicted transcriptional regulator
LSAQGWIQFKIKKRKLVANYLKRIQDYKEKWVQQIDWKSMYKTVLKYERGTRDLGHPMKM